MDVEGAGPPQDEDLVGEAIDLIVAAAQPLTPGQRAALRQLLAREGANNP